MRTVTVKSGNYPVLIGPGLLKEAGERIAQSVRGRRCAVVTDDRVGPLYAKLPSKHRFRENAGRIQSR